MESQPAVCPSDQASFLVEARFVEVQNRRCVSLADLGPLAAEYKTIYQGADDVHNLARRVDRPDGRKAKLELDFRAGGADVCLHSVAITIANR